MPGIRVSAKLVALAAVVGSLAVVPMASAASAPVEYAGVGAGDGPGSAAAARSAFEAALGGADNGTQPGPIAGGYRELNWSGTIVPLHFFGSTVGTQTFTPASGPAILPFPEGQTGVSLTSPSAVALSVDGFSYPALFQAAGSSTVYAPVGSTRPT